MTERIRVKVTVDTDELRHWAAKHADAGHHGVAHVLYQAANAGESLTEQAIREAKAEEREGILSALKERAERMRCAGGGIYTRDYVQGFEQARRIAREVP